MLSLTRSVYEDVLDHAEEDVPQEACGILAGTKANGDAHATTAYRTQNAADTPRVAYEIDPTEQLRVMEEIEDMGRDVVGFYHSHPAGPAHPSETDRAQATWDGYHYLLVSLAGRPPILDAWVWTGEQFERDAVRVE